MLALSRKVGEAVVIGEDVRVTIIKVRGDTVTLGIEAPREVPVHRKEVSDSIKEGEQRARDDNRR